MRPVDITINGKDYPAHLGMATNQEFADARGIGLGDLGTEIDKNFYQYLYIAMKNGARKSKKAFAFTCWQDVADLFDEDINQVATVAEQIAAAFPQDEGEGKK